MVYYTPKESFGVSLWKDINKEFDQLKHNYVFIMGNRSRINFLEDSWCGDSPLKEVFPKLYSLTGKGVKDWEVGEAQRFLSFLYFKKKKRIRWRENDLLCWKGDRNEVYTVRANMTC